MKPRVVDGLALHLRTRLSGARPPSAAQSALQVAQGDGGAPAVIVSDMRMPGMDGATLLQHVKQLYPETHPHSADRRAGPRRGDRGGQ